MIINFSVGNYLSFKDLTTISFIPRSIKDNENHSVFSTPYKGLELLKGGAFIGANASGKSNILKAIRFMQQQVLTSFNRGANDTIDVEHFKLSPQLENQPSFFEIIFLIDNVKYRYGFEISKTHIHKEYLFYSTKRSEKIYFNRINNEFENSSEFLEGHRKVDTRPNSLFVSAMAQNNGNISLMISKWFQDLTLIADDYTNYIDQTATKTKHNSTFKKNFKKILELADLGFEDFEIIDLNLDELIHALPESIKMQLKNSQQQIRTYHKLYDGSGNHIKNIEFDLRKEESQGTIKYFSLAGPIVEALTEGTTLIIDELDSKLHPHLCSAIIKLFNSNTENINNAQLIFSTQNHNFLEEKILRRDQVFFVEKNQRGETTISNTMSSKKIRNDASHKKDYDSGKYGARPNLKFGQLSLFK